MKEMIEKLENGALPTGDDLRNFANKYPHLLVPYINAMTGDDYWLRVFVKKTVPGFSIYISGDIGATEVALIGPGYEGNVVNVYTRDIGPAAAVVLSVLKYIQSKDDI